LIEWPSPVRITSIFEMAKTTKKKPVKKERSDARRNLSLRRALDRARAALLRRDLETARRAIEKAGEQGPLAVRPTRLLWEVAFRWLRARGEAEGGTLDGLFTAEKLGAHVDAGDAARAKEQPEKALVHYRKALALSPLSPETIYKVGLACADAGDMTEAAHWLRLVPDILGPERRRGPIARGWVSDSLLTLAKIELGRGHRSRSAALALKALDVRPDSPDARQFLWDLENKVGR
jgi:tetratricopeptide (TPR) repeat protein